MEKTKQNCVQGKIITLPVRQSVSDEDIMALFSGLIKLIKKNAMECSEQAVREHVTCLKKQIAYLKMENKILKDGGAK